MVLAEALLKESIGFPIFPISLAFFLCVRSILNNNNDVVDLPLVPVIVILRFLGYTL